MENGRKNVDDGKIKHLVVVKQLMLVRTAVASFIRRLRVQDMQHKVSPCCAEGRFDEAEEEFVRAGKPKEAIEMYCHQQDWPAAMRVAETCHPASVPDICALQVRHTSSGMCQLSREWYSAC